MNVSLLSSPELSDLNMTSAVASPTSSGTISNTSSILSNESSSLPPDLYSGTSNMSSEAHPDFWPMDNPDEMLNPVVINEYFIPVVITHSVAFLVGVIGNLLVVSVMAGDRKSRTATNLFLVSLSLADLLLLIVAAPLETLQYFVIQWDAGGTVCKMAKYAEILSAAASVLNLTAVSLERYIVIVYPMRSRSLCTMSNCKKAVVVVWSVSMVLTAPVLITKEIQPERFGNNFTQVTIHYCRDKESMGLGYSVYQFLVLFAVPALLMIFFYSRVISELWKSTRTMKQMTGARSHYAAHAYPAADWGLQPSVSVLARSSLLGKSNGRKAASGSPVLAADGGRTYRKPPPAQNKGEDVMKARKQVIKMLLLVIALFLVCWGPRLIMEIFLKVGLYVYSPVMYTVRIAFFLMPFIHACINPFVYCFMSKNLQRSMRRQLQRLGIRCPSGGTDQQPMRSGVPTGTESTRHTYCTTTESVL